MEKKGLDASHHDDNHEQFRLMVESVQDYAIFMLDPHGRIATWNAGANRIKGYEANELIGKHFSCYYPAEDIESGKPWCEVLVVNEDRSVQQVSVSHADPVRVKWVRELREDYLNKSAETDGIWNVLRTGKAELRPAMGASELSSPWPAQPG